MDILTDLFIRDLNSLTSRGSNPGLPEGLFRAQTAPKELRFCRFVVGICASKLISWDMLGISCGYLDTYTFISPTVNGAGFVKIRCLPIARSTSAGACGVFHEASHGWRSCRHVLCASPCPHGFVWKWGTSTSIIQIANWGVYGILHFQSHICTSQGPQDMTYPFFS